ncbi:hypothetical protein GKT70_13845 [Salmonella enterica]|nr:hypothetical protein [Salmonella enterica]
MRYISFVILLIGGLISFNTYALVTVDNFTYTPEQCAARPPLLNVLMSGYWDTPDGQTYVYYDGCEYIAHDLGIVISDGYFSSWYPTGRVQPSVTGIGSGPVGTGSGNGPIGPGTGGTGGGSGSGSTPGAGGSGTGGSGSGSGNTPGTGWTDSTGWDSGSTGGSGGSSGGSSGSGGTNLNFNYGGSTGSTGRPGETVHTFPSPPFIYTPPGEVSELEVLNYMKDFFIYNKECGSSCINYFNKNNPLPKPLSCEDLAFNLNVPHKKPDCRSDDIAWYDKDGRFIQFKYGLTDKAHHDFINKLKGDFGLGSTGNTPFYPGVTPLPSGSLPVEVTNPVPNFFNVPGSAASGYHGPYTNMDGLSPFTLLTGILTQSEFISSSLHRIDEGQSAINMAQNQIGWDTLRELKSFHYDSNNGDSKILSELEGVHSDLNKNHKETMDTIANLPQETPDLIEGYLSPKLNSIIDGIKKEMTDGYNDALKEFKDTFGDIDSYIPDIELSFNLPVQFTNGIMGRCVPLVFDFNIALIGFQPYHFHAEGVQACQLYDAYIRSIVEYMLYFLTALACRRVFTRAAEFITSQP